MVANPAPRVVNLLAKWSIVPGVRGSRDFRSVKSLFLLVHSSWRLTVVGLRLCHLLTGQRKCHPMRDLTLNQQEQTRIQVLNSVLEYGLPIAQASEIMGLSQRHTKRLLAAYRRDGPAALAHGNRGRRPHNAVPEAAAAAVVELVGEHYAGANHTHLTELLREREAIDLSRPTVRRILTRAGMGSPRSRRSPQHRFRRRRMPQKGMLVQVDGSHHRWLEERGMPQKGMLVQVDGSHHRWLEERGPKLVLLLGGRRHRCCGPGDLPHHGRHPRLHGAP